MALATVGDLLSYARTQLNSEVVGADDSNALWTDAELISYINQAQKEFSRKSLCLADRSNFTLAVVADTREYTYDPKILRITAGRLTGAAKRLQGLTFEEMERSWSIAQDTVERLGGWEAVTGEPSHIIQDLEIDKLYIWPQPIVSDTLTLYVRKVADDVTATTDVLEIPEQFREGLNLRVMALAYLKHDVLETEDVNRSMALGQKWESFLNDAMASINKRLGGI
jgi:hypothetical protein